MPRENGPRTPETIDVRRPISTEGSVTTADGKFVRYPDGLVLTFESVEDITAQAVKENPGSFGPDFASSGLGEAYDTSKNRILRVHFTAENKGSGTIKVDPDKLPLDSCFYGQNRVPGGAVGFIGSTLLGSKDPTQLAPGTSFDFYGSCGVTKMNVPLAAAPYVSMFTPADNGPMAGLAYSPFTFTDLEKVLKG